MIHHLHGNLMCGSFFRYANHREHLWSWMTLAYFLWYRWGARLVSSSFPLGFRVKSALLATQGLRCLLQRWEVVIRWGCWCKSTGESKIIIINTINCSITAPSCVNQLLWLLWLCVFRVLGPHSIHFEDSSPARIYSTKQICCPDLLVPRGSQSVLGVPYLASAAEKNSPVLFVDVVDPTLGRWGRWG